MREIAPIVPGKIRPGFRISTVIPNKPIDMRSTIRFGSMRVSRIRFQSDISTVSMVAPLCGARCLLASFHPVDLVEQRRQIRREDVDDVLVQRALAPRFDASRTAPSAQSPFRPWDSASSRM